MVLSQGGVCFKNFFGSGFVFEHFKDYGNHDPSVIEGGFSMADFRVNDNIFVDLNSHVTNSNKDVYKLLSSDFGLREVTGVYGGFF